MKLVWWRALWRKVVDIWWLVRRGFRTSQPLADPGCEVSEGPLQLGRQLGKPGGQGSVFEVKGSPGLAYKQYTRRIHGARKSFEVLQGRYQCVRDNLTPRVFLAWPRHIFGQGEDVEGYSMARIPDAFGMEVKVAGGTRMVAGKIEYAVPRPSLYGPVVPPTADERLEVAMLIGYALDSMHRNGVCYRDLSWNNMLFALRPTRLAVMDLDSARALDVPTIRDKDGVETADWWDPAAPGEEPVGFDLDRYKYALLVHRLLVTHEMTSPLVPGDGQLDLSAMDGVPVHLLPRFSELFRRVTLGRGGRPAVEEWLRLMELARGAGNPLLASTGQEVDLEDHATRRATLPQ